MSEEKLREKEEEWESPPIKDTFYLLRKNLGQKDQEIRLSGGGVKKAIKRIREYLKTKIPYDNIELMKIDVASEKLKAEGVSWGEISYQLIQAEAEQGE